MITAIVDLQFGSTGKGLIAGYLSQKHNYDVVVSANMPNAGHTFVDSKGKKWVNKVLPSGVYSKDLKFVCIGPGAVFDVTRLSMEVEELRLREISAEVIIHPAAALLLPEHKDWEQNNLSGISSTMQGSMAAMFHKMQRSKSAPNVAGSAEMDLPDGCRVVGYDEWNTIMMQASEILMEGSQGYSLGLNAGFYPYCTSRDCTVWRLMADCGVIMRDRLKVIGTARVHPIRVGNTPDGNSGPCYYDQHETSWGALGQTPETTTVTGRVRRVFTFSEQQVRDAIMANRVDEVFLNFCNYDPREAIRITKAINGMRVEADSVRGIPDFVRPSSPLVKYLGFGPQSEDIMEVSAYEY